MAPRDPPLWMRYHPELLDKELVLSTYKRVKNQRKAAAIFGCDEKTFRKALRYHGVQLPIVSVPDKVREMFKN